MQKLLDLLSLNMDFTNNISYRRVLLITGMSLVTAFTFILFTFINTFIVQNFLIAILDFIATTISIFVIIYLYKTHNIQLAAKIATTNLMFFFFFLVFVNGNSHFSLIWTIFLPIFAILANGKNIGIYFSLAFYTPILLFAYYNIGIWENGMWTLVDWLRFSSSAAILTFAMYMNEKSLEASDIKLEEIRLKEQQHIQELHEKSITDELTGLYNRRYFYDMVPKLSTLAKRQELYITFFILDIDYFKNYNDYYGHVLGDKTLRLVADAIKEYIHRGDDFVFRLGGEEFAGIVLSKNKESTHEWIQGLCKVVEDLQLEHIESEVANVITISIGIATISHNENRSIDNLYSFADQALYTAKNNGKNRCELSFRCS